MKIKYNNEMKCKWSANGTAGQVTSFKNLYNVTWSTGNLIYVKTIKVIRNYIAL